MTENERKDMEDMEDMTDIEKVKKVINDLVELKKDATEKNKDKETYYDLWKFYQGRVELLKDRLWTMGTWMMAILGAILAIIIDKYVITESWPPVKASGFLFFLAILGLVLAGYSYKIIGEYTEHIQSNMWGADYLRSGLKKEKENFSKVAGANILRNVAMITFFVFIVIIVIIVISAIWEICWPQDLGSHLH